MNPSSLRAYSLGVAALACLLAAPAVAGTVDYVMVPVGNPGNANDISRLSWSNAVFGAVDASYQIGKYDVTIGQYTAFLNAVDPTGTNPNGIYNASMGTDLRIAGISYTSGAAAGSKYSVMAVSGSAPSGGVSDANRPITYVSWFDAARFANWMSNGQGNGSTETGAYTLNNATSGNAVVANAGAAFTLPTENQWYKAAYYDPTLSGGSGGYSTYATQSNTAPGNVAGTTANQANYQNGVFSASQSQSYSLSQNYLTDVGAFTDSKSFYGTFDQSGNVWQWYDLDSAGGPSTRGGFWWNPSYWLSSSGRQSFGPSYEADDTGFRLAGPAAVPEIDPSSFGSAFALLIGSLGWVERRALRVFGLVTAT